MHHARCGPFDKAEKKGSERRLVHVECSLAVAQVAGNCCVARRAAVSDLASSGRLWQTRPWAPGAAGAVGWGWFWGGRPCLARAPGSSVA